MRTLVISRSITRRDEQSLGKYLNDISKKNVLTAQEEVELFKRIEMGDEYAVDLIVQHNLRFVVSVAKQYQVPGIWLGDLINEGNIGLIKAARRFDYTKGFKFISYAVWWIRQSILQALHEKGRNIRVPLNVNNQISKVNNTIIEFLQKEEREPSRSEISEITGLSLNKVDKALEFYNRTKSLDAKIGEDSKNSFVSLLEDTSIPRPDFNSVVNESLQIQVKELLRYLNWKETKVLVMFYGIGQDFPNTLSDIGDELGLTRERVRQIKDKSLRKLRVKANDMDMSMI